MQGEHLAEELLEYSIEDLRRSWDEVARWWSEVVRSGQDVCRERLHGPALLAACGDVRGRRALDIGCGEGWCSRQLAARGAAVTGIDLSAAMIAEARAHPTTGPGVEYLAMDAVELDRHEWPASFDLVTACMSLHCMPDPGAALLAARQVLAPDGRLVCSIPHPATHMRGGRGCSWQADDTLCIRGGDYFKSAPYVVQWDKAGRRWSTIRWSRPRSEYVGMLRSAGFAIRDELEPCPTDADLARHECLRRAGQAPFYLVFVAEAASSPV